jgi:hypothetical protein
MATGRVAGRRRATTNLGIAALKGARRIITETSSVVVNIKYTGNAEPYFT